MCHLPIRYPRSLREEAFSLPWLHGDVAGERLEQRTEAERGPIHVTDPDATAAVLLVSLTYYPILNVLLGHPPGDIDADRFTEAWIQHATATLANE